MSLPHGQSPEAAKEAAVRQWTADPCGSGHLEGDPGGGAYFRELIKMRHEYAPWMADALGHQATAGLDVLDVGCGQGIDLASYAMAGARAVGIDLTPRHVELASSHLKALGLEAEAVLGDAEQLPFGDGSFDVASSNGVLHHTPDMLASLREMRRVLRPGGSATVIVYNRSSLHYWLHQFLVHGVLRGGLIRERGMAGVLSRNVEHSSVAARPLVRVQTRRALAREMTAAGFVDVAVAVRHFRAEDTLPTRWAAPRVRALRRPENLERIGRLVGWYLVGTGNRPAAVTRP